MTSRSFQTLLALVFLTLGGWCMIWPGMVEGLVLRAEFVTGGIVPRLLIGCFGAQAVLCGTVIAVSDFRPRSFLVFGVIGSLPFFAFNYYFYVEAQIFTRWMLLDFVGNLVILGCCLCGYSLARRGL